MVKLKISQKKEDEPPPNTTSKKRLSLSNESPNCQTCKDAGIQCIKEEIGCSRCNTLKLECSFDSGKKKRTSWSLEEDSVYNFGGNFEQNLMWHMDFLSQDMVPSYYENKRHSLKDENAKLEVERLEQLIEQQRQEIIQLKNGNVLKKQEIQIQKPTHEIRDFTSPFSLGYEKSSLPMIFLSTTGQILSYNESFGNVFGFASSDITNRTIMLMDIIRKEDCELYFSALERSCSYKERKFKIACKSQDGFKKYIFSFEVMVEEYNQSVIACFGILAV
jgi:PAS domain-containing protein